MGSDGTVMGPELAPDGARIGPQMGSEWAPDGPRIGSRSDCDWATRGLTTCDFVFSGSLHRCRHIADEPAFWAVFSERVHKCKRCAPSLPSVLLDNDHSAVQRELERLKVRLSETEGAKESFGTDKLWPEKHMAYFDAHKLPWGHLRCEKKTLDSPFYSALPSRERQILAVRQKTNHADITADLGQSIDRTAVSETMCHVDGSATVIAPTCLPNMHMWSGEKQRLLIGRESLMLQAYPCNRNDVAERLDCFSESFLADLGGNAYCGTVLTALFLSLLASIPWIDTDQEMAMLALKSSLGFESSDDDA
jgi:hypothetical protein